MTQLQRLREKIDEHITYLDTIKSPEYNYRLERIAWHESTALKMVLEWVKVLQDEQPTELLSDKEIMVKFTRKHEVGIDVVDEKQYDAAKWARDVMLQAFESIVKEAYDTGCDNGAGFIHKGEKVLTASEYWEQLKERMR